jgi:sigma-54 dependent transcriptional regulator, acetoin dehydrogenase operon transcriptional activator AcoR
MADETVTHDLGAKAPGTAQADRGLLLLYAPEPQRLPVVTAIGSAPVVLGREPPPGGIAIPLSSVSRLHARVQASGDAVFVEDLESRNGTFVNGRRIDTRRAIEDGDEIRVGEVVMKLVAEGASAHGGFPLAGIVPRPPFEALRGGRVMDLVRADIARVSQADLSVLVLGETGTGKELVARALHDSSGRKGRFAAVNCAAIPTALLESELFGYRRGAFTGADRDRVGLVKSAHGGTLFLDEIGDMPLDAQAKVLRMIETRTVTPLGSHASEPVDVRVVCATHRPIARLVREERFRADLYARIAGHTILVPPLRDRKEDIYQLAALFLERAGGGTLAPRFMIGLVSYDWPFNVRELDATVRRAVALSPNGVLDEAQLPPEALESPEPAAIARPAPPTTRATAPTESELRELLVRHRGNVAAIARDLGKDRVQIRRWLARYELVPDEFRSV